jgi:hypothetical protein
LIENWDPPVILVPNTPTDCSFDAFFYLDTNVETEDAIFFEGKRDEEVVEYDDIYGYSILHMFYDLPFLRHIFCFLLIFPSCILFMLHHWLPQQERESSSLVHQHAL